MIKLLHLADLHLDRRFVGLSPARSSQKREELRSVVKGAFEFALRKDCKAVIISGDLFDSEYYTASTLEFLIRCFEQMPQISFIISPGNHDPYNSVSPYIYTEFPKNVHVFKNERLSNFTIPDLPVTVYGYAFTSSALNTDVLADFSGVDRSFFNILCAHTEIDVPLTPYAPMSSKEIARCGFDYAALGHIHTPPEIIRTENTLVAYSGCIAGSDFTEHGKKGGILITLDNENGRRTVSAERVCLCPWAYETVNVSASETADTQSLAQKIRSSIARYGTEPEFEYIIRVVLNGQLFYDPDPVLLKELLSDLPYLKDIKNECITHTDIYGIAEDISIRGEFYRALLPMLESDDLQTRKRATLALKYGLSALSGSDISIRLSDDRG